jgi:peptidoglycan hydrolase-like protein with peptidoglycan-binding domain
MGSSPADRSLADRSRAGGATANEATAEAPTAGELTVEDASLAAARGGGGTGDDERPRSRRRVRLVAVVAVVVAAVATTVVVLLQSGSPTHAGTSTVMPPGTTTTTVERRTLEERSQIDGTLGYSGASEVYDRLSGTFTWLPAVGAVIGRGGTLYRINNLPVALMYGSLPAYRALKEGVSDGPDVSELNANLIDLGFDPEGAITDEDHFGEATATAVRRWQQAEGLSKTGEVELGRVVFASDARRITAVKVTFGDDPPPASSAKEPSAKEKEALEKEAREKAEKVRAATEKPAKEPSTKGSKAEEKEAKEKESNEKESKERTEKEKASKEPTGKEKEKEKEKSGEPAAAPKAVLGTTGSQQIVQLQVKANQQQLAHVGESAPVTLPDGRIVQAHITNVGTVATEEEKGGGNEKEKGGNGENATIAVTLALDHPVARLDKAPVSVELVKSIRRNVLAVPATTLVATAGGGYAIEVVEARRRVELAVTPGMFANGYVEIEGPGVHEGLTVTEPQ